MTAPLNTSPAIIVRQTPDGMLFLDHLYQWTPIPADIIVDWWHLQVALGIATDRRNPKQATGYARVDTSKPIDLDKLEIIPL